MFRRCVRKGGLMPGSPWTDADTAKLRDLHAAEGMTLNRAAKLMGRGSSTISRKSKALGLSWERPVQVVIATQANVIDIRARKAAAAAMELRLLEMTQQHLHDGIESKSWTALVRGEGGGEYERELSTVPARDLRDLASARSSSAQVIARLSDDSDRADIDTAKSMLAALGAALQGAVEPVPE